MLVPQRDRIERALGLFGEGAIGQPHSLSTRFECLGAEMSVRHLALSQAELGQLNRLFSYASRRLSDIFTRRNLIDFLRSRFDDLSGEDLAAWHSFGALCIKDFHADLGSFMDAVAPVVLQACGAYNTEGEVKLPGFPDIQHPRGSPKAKAFRAGLPDEVVAAIDTTNSWWPDVKVIRNILMHREHDKMVFGGPGVVFQIYTPGLSPQVVHPVFLWPHGHNVADFRLYSAYVIAEVLVFLEELGTALASHLKLSIDGLTGSFRVGDLSYLIDPLREIEHAIA